MENAVDPQEIPVEKKVSKNVWFVSIVAVLLLIVAAYIVFEVRDKNLTGNVIQGEEKFEFKGFQILNQEQIKKECPYIRVGRCDAIGGEFGTGCWFRGVETKFEIQNIDTKNIKCSATTANGVILGGSQILESASEPNTYKLIYEMDIRKNNDVTICCDRIDKSSKSCFPEFNVPGIC